MAKGYAVPYTDIDVDYLDQGINSIPNPSAIGVVPS